ncbi:MAG: hypothetical protein E7513_02780 [Ruminococcaceae bacterium]|nr:hypothetical protein [Oscillospiraceae bacterium]
MKKALSAFCSVILMLCFALNVSAENTFLLSLSSDQVDNNRLFTIDVCADGDSALCGGRLFLSFDNAFVEYRDIESDIFEVKAIDSKGTLDIVFASQDAQSISTDTVLFSVEFKSIGSGTFEMRLGSKECVDEALEKIDIGSAMCSVTIDKNKVTSKTIKSKSDSSKIAVKTEKSKVTGAYNESSDGLEFDSMSINKDVDNSKAIFYGVCAGLVVVIVFVLGMLFAKKQDKNTNQK